jgi:hypothetical protein
VIGRTVRKAGVFERALPGFDPVRERVKKEAEAWF